MNTWGISGPAFLATYGVLLALVVSVVVIDRLRAEGGPKATHDLDDYDLAVLNGGGGLATSVALLALDRAGAVELGDRMVRQLAVTQNIDLATLTERGLFDLGIGMEVVLTGPVPPGAHPVEVDDYLAVVASSTRRAADVRRIADELASIQAMQGHLVDIGLLRGPAELARRLRQWLWFVPVLLLGTVGLVYGLSRGEPVIYLVGLLVLTVIAMIIMATRAVGQRTRRGDRLFDEMRNASRGGTSGSTGTLTAREDAGHLLAVGGWDGLWSADRPLALAVGAGGLAALEAERQASSFWAWTACSVGSTSGCASCSTPASPSRPPTPT